MMRLNTFAIMSLLASLFLIGCETSEVDDSDPPGHPSQVTPTEVASPQDTDPAPGDSPDPLGSNETRQGAEPLNGDHNADTKPPSDPEPGSKDSSTTSPEELSTDPQDSPLNTKPAGDSIVDANTILWRNAYGKVTTAGLSLSGRDTEITMDIAVTGRTVPQEELISFIESHPSLFTTEQYQKLTTHPYFRERGYGAGLLLGMLGLAFGGSFDYYRTAPQAPMVATTDPQKEFLSALRELKDKAYELRGKCTVVSDALFASSPRIQTEVTRLKFADGSTMGALNTQLTVTDQDGGKRLQGKAGQAPLGLFSVRGSSPSQNLSTLDVTGGYTVVAQDDLPLGEGERRVMEIAKPVQSISHDQLVAFVTDHRSLFSKSEYNAIVAIEAFDDPTLAPELLLGILGAKLGGSPEYFTKLATLEITAYNPGDQEFVTALSALRNGDYTLSGKHSVVGKGSFSAAPTIFAKTVKVVLPNGDALNVLSTRVSAADKNGETSQVQSEADAATLDLLKR